MSSYFFTATESAHAQITKLFDFVWPTAAAMWNLRWQVSGYLQAVPDAVDAQLQARFIEGAAIHGANLKRACVDHTWDEQKEAFARIVLVNTFAIYESWIEELMEDLGKNTRTLQKKLQFPDTPLAGGVRSAIAEITTPELSVFKQTFYGSLCSNRHYALPTLDALMWCYRYFKELRNCDVHSGGIAGQMLLDAYTAFVPVATSASLGVNEVPIHDSIILGARPRISLRGVVGFSNVVIKLMTTLDAEMSRSPSAQQSFAKKWKHAHPAVLQLPRDPSRRGSKLKRAIRGAGFPRARNLGPLADWLKMHRLVFF